MDSAITTVMVIDIIVVVTIIVGVMLWSPHGWCCCSIAPTIHAVTRTFVTVNTQQTSRSQVVFQQTYPSPQGGYLLQQLAYPPPGGAYPPAYTLPVYTPPAYTPPVYTPPAGAAYPPGAYSVPARANPPSTQLTCTIT